MKTLLFTAFFCTTFTGLAFAQTTWPPSGTDCVRWVVQKRMFLVKEIKVAGYNCTLGLAVKTSSPPQPAPAVAPVVTPTQPKPAPTTHIVSVTIPLNGFDSGEPDRDEAVTALLGGKRSPNLRFTTKPLSGQQWQSITNGTLKQVAGTLDVNGRAMPMTLALRYDSTYIFGDIRTAFSRLRITPPVVAGGAIAKVRDPLRLEFRLARASLEKAVSN